MLDSPISPKLFFLEVQCGHLLLNSIFNKPVKRKAQNAMYLWNKTFESNGT